MFDALEALIGVHARILITLQNDTLQKFVHMCKQCVPGHYFSAWERRPVNSHDFVVSLTILDLISRSHDNIIISHDLKALATHALLRMRVQTPLS